MTNIQRGRLLHQLFPEQIPALLQFSKDTCVDPEVSVGPVLMDAGYTIMEFQEKADIIYSLIEKYGFRMQKSRKVFSEILFAPDTIDVISDLIVRYAQSEHCSDPKFICAVELLFIPVRLLDHIGDRIQGI